MAVASVIATSPAMSGGHDASGPTKTMAAGATPNRYTNNAALHALTILTERWNVATSAATCAGSSVDAMSSRIVVSRRSRGRARTRSIRSAAAVAAVNDLTRANSVLFTYTPSIPADVDVMDAKGM